MPSHVVSAPGKAILAGEYAVLHGAPAISVAVDRYVVARAGAGADSPFVRAAKAHAERASGGAAIGDVAVDSSALFDGGGATKLGLGSSAAVTAAVVGYGLATNGVIPDARTLFEVADAAHAEGQGTRGSGVDVATSVYGGVIRFVRKLASPQKGGRAEGPERGPVNISSVDLPDDLFLTFIWAGVSASTGALVTRIAALAESDPARHLAVMGRLITQAHAFAGALEANDARALIGAAENACQAMAALGDAAGVALVTEPHARLSELARRHGGAAKPSGAGGGDLGVAFTVGEEDTAALRTAIVDAGLHLLSLGAPARGVHFESENT